jgi:hypothetical protein
MRTRSTLIVLALLTGLLLPPSPPAHAAALLELYGTFHAMGIIVTLDGSDDPDGDAVASVEYRVGGSGPYRQGFPLSRVAGTRFVGSLFWLEPDKSYDVRVTFSDPDGDPLDSTTVTATGSTRAEIAVPAPTHSYLRQPHRQWDGLQPVQALLPDRGAEPGPAG